MKDEAGRRNLSISLHVTSFKKTINEIFLKEERCHKMSLTESQFHAFPHRNRFQDRGSADEPRNIIVAIMSQID